MSRGIALKSSVLAEPWGIEAIDFHDMLVEGIANEVKDQEIWRGLASVKAGHEFRRFLKNLIVQLVVPGEIRIARCGHCRLFSREMAARVTYKAVQQERDFIARRALHNGAV